MKDTDKELIDDLATLNHKQKLKIKELEREVVELKNIISTMKGERNVNEYTEHHRASV